MKTFRVFNSKGEVVARDVEKAAAERIEKQCPDQCVIVGTMVVQIPGHLQLVVRPGFERFMK